ncbi:MAG: hypothetical protein GY761_16915 [Hyphomicrobiales bacterium]|nr:hypothetical protein [Hyphomicrobiales bacterium]
MIENLGGSSFANTKSGTGTPLILELENDHHAKKRSIFKAGIIPENALIFDKATENWLR